jgi:hypothetical protein
VKKIKLKGHFSWEHLTQFVNLWGFLSNIHLEEAVDDTIVWKLTENGLYSAASAYELQFLGLVLSDMNALVWKVWANSKAKNHAWLALQTAYGRPIDSRIVDGQIAGFTLFTSKLWRQTTIFLLLVASPQGCGSSSKNGLDFKGFILDNVWGLTSRNGGHSWWLAPLRIARSWLP